MKRIRFLDVAKGTAILGVVFSHTLHFSNDIFLNFKFFVGSYMVMLFYITSGYVYGMKQHCKISTKDYFLKQCSGLMIPYIFFSALQILIDIVLVGTSNEGFVIATNLNGWKIVLGDIYKTACFKGIGTLWFISSLFICNMIFHIQKKKERTIVFDIVLLFFEGCVAYGIFLVLQTANKNSLVFEIMSAPFVVIGRALFAVPLMYVGYSVQKYRAIFFDNEKVSFIWAGIFGTVAVALTLLFRGISPYDLNHLYIPKPHIIYLLGITGSLFVLTLSYGLSKIVRISFLEKCSQCSMVIMCVHYPLRPFTDSFSYAILRIVNDGLAGYYEVVSFILLVVISLAVADFLQNRYPILVGRKRGKQ